MKKLILALIFTMLCACSTNQKWNASDLKVADELISPENIVMDLIDQTKETLTVRFTNNDNENWMYGEHFSIQVLLNNNWYVVPLKETYGFIGIGYILEPNSNVEKTYKLSIFNELPKGNYRIVVDGLNAEFEVK